MNILITNDDGIDSPFLRPLVDAFSSWGDITLAAPATQQSWISKAMSRFKDIELKELDGFDCPAYSLTGSPADCVNIALGHLVEGKIDLVVSGINVGHNTGLSFIASSGTVGAALEAALHQTPAIAASMALRPEEYEELHNTSLPADNRFVERAKVASQRLVEFAKEKHLDMANDYAVVHNINFPFTDFANAPIRETRAMDTISTCLYQREGNKFNFEYSHLRELRDDHLADLKCLKDGDISYSRLDFSKIS